MMAEHGMTKSEIRTSRMIRPPSPTGLGRYQFISTKFWEELERDRANEELTFDDEGFVEHLLNRNIIGFAPRSSDTIKQE